MRIDILTLFTGMCEAVLSESIVGRARKNELIDIRCHDMRDYTTNKHKRVDDSPYGGGMGMVLQPQPVYDCYEAVCRESGSRPHVIYLSPKGAPFCQRRAVELSRQAHLMLLCGHYEGIDQRVLDEIVDEELSLGDYVITGGELAALVVADAICRLCDGVLSDASCYTDESHYAGLLEYPQYTRPEEWNGRRVPEVLLSGHHANIAAWRRQQSLAVTLEKRPDLLEAAPLTEQDKTWLAALLRAENQ